MNRKEAIIRPDWPAPASVGAACSTRFGGASSGPYAGLNLATHVGEAPDTVEQNRRLFAQAAGFSDRPQWLEQVHGTRVVEAQGDGQVRTADGCITASAHIPCAVLTADCLPILLCDRAGTQVAAVHAGWRSLAGGIVPVAIEQFRAPPAQLIAWLGPAISARHFEVGVEVLEAFFASAHSPAHTDAIAGAVSASQRPMRFYADLYALARAALHACAVAGVYGGDFCTYAESERFYSYRRDGKATGRMASVVWLGE